MTKTAVIILRLEQEDKNKFVEFINLNNRWIKPEKRIDYSKLLYHFINKVNNCPELFKKLNKQKKFITRDQWFEVLDAEL